MNVIALITLLTQAVALIGRVRPLIDFLLAHKDQLADGKLTPDEIFQDLNDLIEFLKVQPSGAKPQ